MLMDTICKNCSTPVEGKFCSNCGQPSNTHRISAHFLWHDIQHGLFHVDKGILFTTKELFARPGHSIREFLAGKRVKHFKPVSLVLILAGVYGFLSHYFHINLLSNNIRVSGSGDGVNEMKKVVEGASQWLSEHYSLFSLLQIPLLALGTWLFFKKAGYNFFEHVIIHTFLTGQRLLIHIAAFPFYYAFNKTGSLETVARLTDIVSYCFIYSSLYQLFNNLPWWQRVVRIIGSFAIIFLITLIILFFIFRKIVAH